MTFVSTAIEIFLQAFKLKRNSEQIYFDARVDYKLDEKEIQIHTRVAVVTTLNNSHDAIFLLSTYLIALNFPDVFRTDRDLIEYCPGEYLRIIGKNKRAGAYVVLIHPVFNEAFNDW